MHHADSSRHSRPGRWPLLLAALGVFALVLAALFRFVLPGQVVKFPLNEYEVMTLQGHGVSYFSTKQLTELSGVTMRATYTIKGEPTQPAGLGNAAVWQSFTSVQDLTNHTPFQYAYSRLALDRRTGEIIRWSGNRLGSKPLTGASGQSFVWPFNSGKHSYQVFDSTAGRAVPARYAGTATTGGIATYRYVETVTGLRIGSQQVPGSLIGSRAASVVLPEFYTATITYFVDPVTGDPLKISQNELLTLRDTTGATKMVLLRGQLVTTPASVRIVSAPDRKNLRTIAMIGTEIPLTAGILGIALLATGFGLSLRRRPGDTGPVQEELTEQPADRPMLPSAR